MNWLFVAEGASVVALIFVLYKRGTFGRAKGGGGGKVAEKVVAVGKGQISYLVAGDAKAPSTVLLLHGF
ncbi:MAG TPA: hypothetical protein VGS57_21425, partial [Thermoanaerobaculia bacterium]|nr:hypothetical protein [Thermoanaerobaculia bacterium]